MTTTTLNVMLPAFARSMGAYIGTFSTTTDITTSTALISTGITAYFEDDDVLNDTFVRILGTNNDGTVRSVLDHTGSTGALDLRGIALSAESASVDFEVYRYDPSLMIDALNDGRETAFPSLYQEVHDRSISGAPQQQNYARPTTIQPGYIRRLYTENRMVAKPNADNVASSKDVDFEGDLSDWSTTNITLTAEAETSSPNNFMVFAGGQSGKHVVGASSIGTSYVSIDDPTNYDGEELNVTIWVYCKTASRVSAAISLDSGTATTGTVHSGGGWERLKVSTILGAISTSVRVGVHATSGTALTFYADELIAISGPSQEPQPLSNPLPYWREEGNDLVIPYRIPESQQFVVSGMGILSSVSAGTDTMEINVSNARLLYAYSALEFFQGDIDQVDDENQLTTLRKTTHFKNRVASGNGMIASMSKLQTPSF